MRAQDSDEKVLSEAFFLQVIFEDEISLSAGEL